MIEKIRDAEPHQQLCRDTETGIAWIDDGSTGMRRTVHPNIDVSGSVAGMVERGYWDGSDRIVECCGFFYNVSHCLIDDDLDRQVAAECRCGGRH